MQPLDIALVLLVSVWTVISIVGGGFVVSILRKVHGSLDRVTNVLDSAQHVVSDVRVPVRAVADSFREVFAPRVATMGPGSLAQP